MGLIDEANNFLNAAEGGSKEFVFHPDAFKFRQNWVEGKLKSSGHEFDEHVQTNTSDRQYTHLCKDCKWSSFNIQKNYYKCFHTSTGLSPVTGEANGEMCSVCRTSDYLCDAQGRFWEKRIEHPNNTKQILDRLSEYPSEPDNIASYVVDCGTIVNNRKPKIPNQTFQKIKSWVKANVKWY